MESIGLFDVDMTPIKENLKELSKSLQRAIDNLKKMRRLPNGRYRK